MSLSLSFASKRATRVCGKAKPSPCLTLHMKPTTPFDTQPVRIRLSRRRHGLLPSEVVQTADFLSSSNHPETRWRRWSGFVSESASDQMSSLLVLRCEAQYMVEPAPWTRRDAKSVSLPVKESNVAFAQGSRSRSESLKRNTTSSCQSALLLLSPWLKTFALMKRWLLVVAMLGKSNHQFELIPRFDGLMSYSQ